MRRAQQAIGWHVHDHSDDGESEARQVAIRSCAPSSFDERGARKVLSGTLIDGIGDRPRDGHRDARSTSFFLRAVILIAAVARRSSALQVDRVMILVVEKARDYLNGRMQEGDEIWSYAYFPKPGMGDSGYAVVRNGEPICGYRS